MSYNGTVDSYSKLERIPELEPKKKKGFRLVASNIILFLTEENFGRRSFFPDW